MSVTSDTEVKPKDRWERLQSLATTFSIVAVPVIVAWLGSDIQKSVKNAEARQRTLEVAINILQQAAPDARESPLREWAADIIDKTSDVHLSEEARKELVSQGFPTPLAGQLNPTVWGFTTVTTKEPHELKGGAIVTLVSFDQRSAVLKVGRDEKRVEFGKPWQPTTTRCVIYFMAIDQKESGAVLSYACE